MEGLESRLSQISIRDRNQSYLERCKGRGAILCKDRAVARSILSLCDKSGPVVPDPDSAALHSLAVESLTSTLALDLPQRAWREYMFSDLSLARKSQQLTDIQKILLLKITTIYLCRQGRVERSLVTSVHEEMSELRRTCGLEPSEQHLPEHVLGSARVAILEKVKRFRFSQIPEEKLVEKETLQTLFRLGTWLGLLGHVSKLNLLTRAISHDLYDCIEPTLSLPEECSLIRGPYGVDRTLLQYAALHGAADSVRVLIQAGEDVNGSGAVGLAPILLATSTSFPHIWQASRVVQALIDGGANIEVRDEQGGRTALANCIAKGHLYHCAEVLLEAGANLDTLDRAGNSAEDIARWTSPDMRALVEEHRKAREES